MRLLAFSCGWLTAPLGSLLEGEEGTLRNPVPVFLIEHPRGRALFDTGLHPDTATDPEGQIGPPARLFQIHYENGEDVASRLRTLGLEPELWRTLPQAPRELT